MPQVDLETLVSACTGGSTDRKVACEPLADGEMDEHEIHHPDSPPESFWLSGEAEYDWWDRNSVYERNESTKGHSSTNLSTNSNSNSQRYSKNLKYKNVLIGLPTKPQKNSLADARSRRNHRPGNTRLFPKRCASVGGKSDAAIIEPSSPKVSCIGRVRSKRDRNRRLRARQRSISSSVAPAAVSSSTSAAASAAVVRQKSSRSQRKKTGFFASVRALFRSGRKGKPVHKSDLPSGDSSTKKKRSNSRKARGANTTSFEDSVYSEPVALGSMNRFASGRRSDSWVVE